MTILGTGDTRNTESVAVVFAAFMDRVGKALRVRRDAIGPYESPVCKVILGELGCDFVEQFRSRFERDGKFEEVISRWEVEGSLKTEFGGDGFTGGKDAVSALAMVGERDFCDVVTAGEVEVD